MTEDTKELQVWIVDDEPAMRSGAARSLRTYTATFDDVDAEAVFGLREFETGEDVLDALADDAPDIMLLDNKLPGIEGIDVLEHLDRDHSRTVVIMITAYATLEKAVRATKLGAYDFLAKPFTPNELRYSVRKATRDVLLTRRAAELEAEKRRVRFEFISVLAHELKSPLNAIEGYTDLVQHRRLGDELDPYVPLMGRIDTRIGGLRKLIADLLDMTSIESGERPRELAAVPLDEVIAECVEDNQALADDRAVAVTCNHGGVRFTGDRNELKMLVNNFVSNGIKYNKEGGRLCISALQQPEHVVLTFADTGIGLSQEEQERLFNEFTRIKNNQTRDIEGSGLGLSIVRKIVQLYDGTVDVDSTPDEGTTFTVTLPNQGAPTMTQKVLLVDDDQDLLEQYKLVLNQEFDVTAVTSGADARKVVDELDPAVIVMDVMMDTLSDGLDTAKQMQEDGQLDGRGLIMLTGVNDVYNYRDAIDEDYFPKDKWLNKPVKPDQLLKETKALLES